MIPVYRPHFTGKEKEYVNQCLDSTWISSRGGFIAKFEEAFAAYTGSRHAVSVCNGTVALHLALAALGVGPGDEVIVPSLTYVASVNVILQVGAKPVYADSLPHSWQMDPADVRRKVTERTRAVMAVHLYGLPCDMDPIVQLCADNHLLLVEDCAEAFGTLYKGRHVGSFGDIGTFSFFGNKTITTGEGGMVIANDDALAQRMLQARGQGQSFTRRYWHEVMGFNYRMTNIVAAIGLAQIERLDAIVAAKRHVSARYRALLAGLPVTFQMPGNGVDGPEWLVSLLLPPGTDRERLMARMADDAVESRPVFYPAHTMPIYAKGEHFPHAENIAARGMSLPSFPTIAESELAMVAESLGNALREQGLA